ncbi:MAG: hypothetical protein ACR2NF_00025 [Pirellulales bacterium]
MAELLIKKQQRNGVVTNIKKEGEKSNDLLAAESTGTALKASLYKLHGYAADFKELNDAIFPLIADDVAALTKEIDDTQSFSDGLRDIISQLEAAIDDVNHPVPTPGGGGGPGSRHNSSTHSDTSSHAVKLPKLSIPTFSGDPMEWQEFWDTYASTLAHPLSRGSGATRRHFRTCIHPNYVV